MKIKRMREKQIDLENMLDQKDIEILKLESARDKFRDQALDLKQELKWLKRNQTRSKSRENKENMQGEANSPGRVSGLYLGPGKVHHFWWAKVCNSLA